VVTIESPWRTGETNLDRVVDDEIDGHERVDLVGVAAETLAGVPHGSQVDHGRHAGEVLERRREKSPVRRL
jgi:hypothetical protein